MRLKTKKVGDDGAVNTVPDRVRLNSANHHCCKAQRRASYVMQAWNASGLCGVDVLSNSPRALTKICRAGVKGFCSESLKLQIVARKIYSLHQSLEASRVGTYVKIYGKIETGI